MYRFRTLRYLFILTLLLFVVSCHDEKKGLHPLQQAEAYYSMLITGQYADFVRGTYGCDSLPEDYMQQRIDLLAQHARVEQRKRGGYVRFTATRDSVLRDSTHLVYLDVLFGDSTHEEIACPLFLHNGKWVMRN